MIYIGWKLQKFLDWTHKSRIPPTVLPAVKNQTGYCSARIRSEDRKIRRLGRKRNSSGSREERTVIQANDDNKKEIRTGRKSEKQKKGKKNWVSDTNGINVGDSAKGRVSCLGDWWTERGLVGSIRGLDRVPVSAPWLSTRTFSDDSL